MPYEGQTFVNARTGQRMTFIELVPEVLRIETVNPPGETREPVHVHPRQHSGAEVISGALVFELEGHERRVAAGESIDVPAGTAHCFWTDGAEHAVAIQTFRPALDIAAFFETYAVLAGRGELTAKGMPGALQLAAMIPEFADEIRVTRPPWIVQRIYAAALGPVARAKGVTARRALA